MNTFSVIGAIQEHNSYANVLHVQIVLLESLAVTPFLRILCKCTIFATQLDDSNREDHQSIGEADIKMGRTVATSAPFMSVYRAEHTIFCTSFVKNCWLLHILQEVVMCSVSQSSIWNAFRLMVCENEKYYFQTLPGRMNTVAYFIRGSYSPFDITLSDLGLSSTILFSV